MIRVDSTRVSGTLIWNVADTSVSELERFCSVGSIETPGLELASLPSLLSFTQRGSPASTASPAQGWRCGCSPPCPGPRWAPWCRHGAAAWAARGTLSHSWSPGPGLSPFQPAGFSFGFLTASLILNLNRTLCIACFIGVLMPTFP